MARRASENGYQIEHVVGQVVSFDLNSFDDKIEGHGALYTHYRAMRCPVGMVDAFDEGRHSQEDHEGCSNGFIYTKAGEFYATFLSNSKEMKQYDLGILDGSTAAITPTRFYDGTTEEVDLVPYDRLYLASEAFLVPHWQLVQANANGKDKMSFNVVKVVDIIDSSGRRYCSEDYKIVKGQIVWTRGGPGIDPISQKGKVYSIRFLYKPYWYVSRLVHQVRVVQVDNSATGERETARAPQSALIQREYIFEKVDNSPETKTSEVAGKVKPAGDGEFGPP